MRRVTLALLVPLLLSSCAIFQEPKTLEQIEANLVCVEYADGMTWSQVRERLGSADIPPLPEPENDLHQNTRVYKDKWVIFFVKIDKFKENGRTRFQEITTKLKVCREKE